jgi:hypothetical protein
MPTLREKDCIYAAAIVDSTGHISVDPDRRGRSVRLTYSASLYYSIAEWLEDLWGGHVTIANKTCATFRWRIRAEHCIEFFADTRPYVIRRKSALDAVAIFANTKQGDVLESTLAGIAQEEAELRLDAALSVAKAAAARRTIPGVPGAFAK